MLCNCEKKKYFKIIRLELIPTLFFGADSTFVTIIVYLHNRGHSEFSLGGGMEVFECPQ